MDFCVFHLEYQFTNVSSIYQLYYKKIITLWYIIFRTDDPEYPIEISKILENKQ